MSFVLPTDNLKLRDFTLADIPKYVEQCQDPKYQRFYDEQDSTAAKSVQLGQLFVEQATESPRTQFNLAIECKQSGEYLGIAGLRLEPNSQASIGCGLLRSSQGKGISEEAMTAIIGYGFNVLGVKRAYAETLSRNRAAVRLCQKVGMSVESIRANDRFFKGRWWDTTILSMTRG